MNPASILIGLGCYIYTTAIILELLHNDGGDILNYEVPARFDLLTRQQTNSPFLLYTTLPTVSV